MTFVPFHEFDNHSTFHNQVERLRNEIKTLDDKYVLQTTAEELGEIYMRKVRANPIVLNTAEYYIHDEKAVQVDATLIPNVVMMPGSRPHQVPGTHVTIAIPFIGDRDLWRVKPSTWSPGSYPNITLIGDEVLLSVEFANQAANPELLKAEIERQIASLTRAIDTLSKDCEKHNASAPGIINAALEVKRNQAQAANAAVSALGIPRKRKD